MDTTQAGWMERAVASTSCTLDILATTESGILVAIGQ